MAASAVVPVGTGAVALLAAGWPAGPALGLAMARVVGFVAPAAAPAAAVWDLLAALPPPLVVVVLAFSPLGEVRASVPVAMLHYGMGWGEAVVWSLLGNLAVAPAAAWAYPRLEAWLRRSPRIDAGLTRLTDRTRRRHGARVQRLQAAAVTGVIAVPLPGTGAWTGVLVAHLFGLRWRDAWMHYYAGVVIATFLVTVLVASGNWVFA